MSIRVVSEQEPTRCNGGTATGAPVGPLHPVLATGGHNDAAPAASLDTIPTITKEEFEAQTEGAYIVHIAGKGNMPTDLRGEDAMDMSKYTTYMEHYNWYESFKKQASIYRDLDANVPAEFHYILMKVRGILEGRQRTKNAAEPEWLVFTFDGDNYQDNSPFTKGIKALIRAGHTVYAFKDKPPSKPTHFDSWLKTAGVSYKRLVDLQGMKPKNYTRPRCDAYVSYGYPKLVSVYQPQKDEEILEDGSDKFGRVRPEELCKPGLVKSSLSSELSMEFIHEFGVAHTPESQRFFMLYNRNR